MCFLKGLTRIFGYAPKRYQRKACFRPTLMINSMHLHFVLLPIYLMVPTYAILVNGLYTLIALSLTIQQPCLTCSCHKLFCCCRRQRSRSSARSGAVTSLWGPRRMSSSKWTSRPTDTICSVWRGSPVDYLSSRESTSFKLSDTPVDIH